MYTIIQSIVLLFSISTIKMMGLENHDSDHYGPYDVNYTTFELCSGPKSYNVTTNSIKLSTEGYQFYGHFNFTFLIPASIDEIKLLVYSLAKQNTKKLLWTYKSTDPCKHFVFAKIIETTFKTRNCIVKKGIYPIVTNFKEIAGLFWGHSFFYGDFLIKVLVNSKKGNVICCFVGVKLFRKDE